MNRKIRVFFGYSLTLALLATVFRQMDFGLTLQLIGKIEIRRLIFTVCFVCPLFYLLKLLKWSLILRTRYPRVNPLHIAHSFFFGFVLGLITPGRVGEFARVAILEGDRSELAYLVFFDRLVDLYAVALLALISCGYFFPQLLIPIILLVLFSFIAFLIVFKKSPDLVNKLKGNNPITEILKKLARINHLFSVRKFTLIIASTVAAYIALTTHFFFVLYSFGAHNIKVVMLVPIILISNLLPVTVGGFGVREWLFLLLSKDFTVPQEIVVNSSILWFSLNLTVAALGLLVFWIAKLYNTSSPAFINRQTEED